VKVQVRSFEVYVAETATRDGLPYPRLARFKGLVLEPARDKRLPEVEAQLEHVLDGLHAKEDLL
jgi:hypothetical protein